MKQTKWIIGFLLLAFVLQTLTVSACPLDQSSLFANTGVKAASKSVQTPAPAAQRTKSGRQ